MIGQLIIKELRINLLSLRLSFAFLMLLPLVGVSVYILCNDYAQRQKDYDAKAALHGRAAATERITVDRPPTPMMALIGGATVTTANSVSLLYYDAPRAKGGYDHTPIYYIFPRTDYLFIVGIVMSLLALLFSYDAISYERERGTLRLALANALPRDIVLLGKWIGGYLALFFPCTIALLLGILILVLHPAVHLATTDWWALCLILLVAWIYLAVFFSMGLLISATTRTTDGAAIRCLFVWVLLALIIPGGAPRVAQRFLPTPSVQEMARKYDQIVADTAETRHNDHAAAAEQLGNTRPVDREEFNRIHRRVRDSILEIEHLHLTRQRDDLREVSNRYEDQLRRQIRLARILSSASPYAVLTDVATTLANTGPESQTAFLKAARGYDKDYFDRQYANREDIHYYSHVEDYPPFHVPAPALGARMKRALPNIVWLMFLGIFCFMGGYLIFLRRPV